MSLSRQLPLFVVSAAVLLASPATSGAQQDQNSCSMEIKSVTLPPPSAEQEQLLHNDWPNLARFHESNARLGAPKSGEHRVVFMGNSIIEGWAPHFDSLFPGRPYIGRGISGQTTPQMLVRFRQDVIQLAPRVVLILAGTNDIAGNTGPSTLQMIENNLSSMAELAMANRIKVVLSSVLPVYRYPWVQNVEPASDIVKLNAWIRDYAKKTGIVYLDFESTMSDARHGLKCELTYDGVHPNMSGYNVMSRLAEKAIATALSARH